MAEKPVGICARCRKTSCDCRRSNVTDERRGNSTQRGYDWNWRRFRKWFLGRHPLCESVEHCWKPAVEVHHVVRICDSRADRLVESNCQSLCHYHHRKLGGRGGRG